VCVYNNTDNNSNNNNNNSNAQPLPPRYSHASSLPIRTVLAQCKVSNSLAIQILAAYGLVSHQSIDRSINWMQQRTTSASAIHPASGRDIGRGGTQGGPGAGGPGAGWLLISGSIARANAPTSHEQSIYGSNASERDFDAPQARSCYCRARSKPPWSPTTLPARQPPESALPARQEHESARRERNGELETGYAKTE